MISLVLAPGIQLGLLQVIDFDTILVICGCLILTGTVAISFVK